MSTVTEETSRSSRAESAVPEPGKEARFAGLILAWFAENRREFPWRETPSPYKVAVAEAMLQKTKAQNAVPVYGEFMRSYPDVQALASANLKELRAMLKPLGLPRRATLLHDLANEIVEKHGGVFPSTESELRKLPGIGPYGAGAIASLAHGDPAAMIDINVMRIAGRVFSLPYNPRSGPSRQLRELLGRLMPPGEEAAFNLALVDLGALVCQARAPLCHACPLSSICDYYRAARDSDTVGGSNHDDMVDH